MSFKCNCSGEQNGEKSQGSPGETEFSQQSFSPEDNERLWLSGRLAKTAKVIFVTGKKDNLAVPCRQRNVTLPASNSSLGLQILL